MIFFITQSDLNRLIPTQLESGLRGVKIANNIISITNWILDFEASNSRIIS